LFSAVPSSTLTGVKEELAMQILYPRCCGLDVHKKTVVACRLVIDADGVLTQEVRTFGTMTADLLSLSDWLLEAGCTHVAMESTGVYWKPIYNLLEGTFTLLLVNAQHLKRVPGRKTDVSDSEWIAQLLQHGLLTASFVPERPQRELRELTRYRTSLIRERSAEVNRLHKTLEGANIKLASVATDLQGKSAREMLRGLVAGITDAAELAQLAQRRMKGKIPELQRALTGRFGPHQRFMVAQHLARLEHLDAQVAVLDQEIAARLAPFEEALARLDTIPGVGRRTAEIFLAEMGTDVSRFPSSRHLAAWAGLCPGQRESGGKRRPCPTRKGDPWLRAAAIEAGQAASRTRQSYLGAQYKRLAARRGAKKAVMAVAHTIVVIAYQLLKHGNTYQELGSQYYDERERERVVRSSVKRLEALGLKVTVETVAAAA
jgi:transposase